MGKDQSSPSTKSLKEQPTVRLAQGKQNARATCPKGKAQEIIIIFFFLQDLFNI